MFKQCIDILAQEFRNPGISRRILVPFPAIYHDSSYASPKLITPTVLWNISFITARKRSLGQGNIFTLVFHSVHRGVLSQHALQVVSQHALQEGAWSGGGGGSAPKGSAWWRPPPGRLLLRAVRILLECILVSSFYFLECYVYTLQDHNNEVASIFCDVCNQLICSLCVCDGDGQHCGHKVLAPHTACAKIKVRNHPAVKPRIYDY